MTAALLLAWRPFLDPMPYSWDFWWVFLFPLCIGVSVVYKSIKCRSMREVPREAAQITLWILGGLATAAVLLVIIVKSVAWSRG